MEDEKGRRSEEMDSYHHLPTPQGGLLTVTVDPGGVIFFRGEPGVVEKFLRICEEEGLILQDHFLSPCG